MSAPAYRLRVLAGHQVGASATLVPGEALSVGRSLDRDVVLREPGVPERLLDLVVDAAGGDVLIDPAGDVLRIDGEPLPAHPQRVPLGATLMAGTLAFVIEAVPGTIAADASVPARTSGAPGSDDAGASATRTPPARPRGRNVPLRLGVAATLACLGLAVWLWRTDAPPPDPGATLGTRLASAFPTLALERAGGAPVVRGFLPGRADAIRLERWIAAAGVPLGNEVRVDADLAERVADVFRVNGIEAEVRSLSSGEAVVGTRVADPEALARVEKRVAEDVPQLRSLTLENVPPPVAADASDAPPDDPGKRVSLVVATEPAHIVTQDRSRYFVGAMLPSGHRIAAIEKNVVHLEKDGVSTELQF